MRVAPHDSARRPASSEPARPSENTKPSNMRAPSASPYPLPGPRSGVGLVLATPRVVVHSLKTRTKTGDRAQSYMDAEIRAIMAQYMPLDKEAEDDIALQDAGPDGMMGGAIGVGEPLGEEPQGNASTGHYTSPDLNEVRLERKAGGRARS